MEREGNDVKLLNQKVSESDDNMVTIKHVRKTMEPSLATIPPTNKCRWLCCVWRQHYYSTKLLINDCFVCFLNGNGTMVVFLR